MSDSVHSLRFTFACIRCGCLLEARAHMSGEKAQCPTCGGQFTIPAVDPRTGIALGSANPADDGSLPTPMHAYASAGDRAPKIERDEKGDPFIVCPRCQRHMPVDANLCTTCGIPFTIEGAATVTNTSMPVQPISTWALTTGVLALLSSCFPVLAPLAIGLGLLAISRARRRSIPTAAAGLTMAWAGIILGGVSLTLFTLFWSGWVW